MAKLDMHQILQDVHSPTTRGLRVDISGATVEANIGNVTISPATDFRVRTYEVTTGVQQVAFSGFGVSSVLIKALSNPGFIRIGKSNVGTSTTDFYLLSPGESLSMNLDSSNGIYFVRHPGEPAGTYVITVFSTN